jgi:DUF1680 family protein
MTAARILWLALLASVSAAGGERALVDTSRSPHAVLGMFGLDEVRWNGGLLGGRFDVCRDTMVPHLWTIFRDDQESHAWSNFLIAAGEGRGRDGRFHGPPFNDGDFLKWLEALAQVYAVTRDPALDRQMDAIIATVVKAQREDGYLHTQKIIPQRQGDARAREFEDREHFETYNMGHLMTAACVHHRATGKTTLLAAAKRAADYLERLAREVPDELARNAICPSHYMGVAELHRVTRDPRHLALLRALIELRDRVPGTVVAADQNQDRVPLREARQAVGHAVRANYLYAGLADLLAETGDAGIARALAALSADVSTRKLYLTGMTGALYDGASPDGSARHGSIRTVHQAYGRDHQLPNLTAYNETCATIGYFMWMWRQFATSGDAGHADLMEQALYNGVLPGISLEGRHYFYVNPLRRLADFKWPLRWSRTRTPNIKSSFCCPPNVVRTIAEAHNYVYAQSRDAVWVNLYAASTLDAPWPEGGRLRLRQETDYPWDGAVRFVIEAAPAVELALRLRIPGWLAPGGARLRVNGAAVPDPSPGTFAEVRRTWAAGDTVEVALELTPVLLEANPLVEETLNQVALRRGPLVYCVEAADLPEGVRLTDVVLPVAAGRPAFTSERRTIAGAEVVMLTVPALAGGARPWRADELYREVAAEPARSFPLTFTPYFAWGNRGEGDMTVWLPRR